MKQIETIVEDIPTSDDIEAAALAWCGEKDRETFNSDLEYFRANWWCMLGLRGYVEKQSQR